LKRPADEFRVCARDQLGRSALFSSCGAVRLALPLSRGRLAACASTGSRQSTECRYLQSGIDAGFGGSRNGRDHSSRW
jgi:hypothetical protein